MSERDFNHAIAKSETLRQAEITAAPDDVAIKRTDQDHFRRVIASANEHGMTAPNTEAALDALLNEPAPYKPPAYWP